MFEIGNSLREARIRQGLEFPELERATKIRGKYLRALEDEQFEVLPGQTYVKGFLRTYAEHLGLDGQLYVDEYNSRYVSGEEETPFRVARVSGTHERRFATSLVLGVLGGIAAVAALVIGAWKFGGSSSPTPAAKTTAKKQHAKKHHTKPPRVVPAPVVLAVRATHGYGSYLVVHAGSAAGAQLYAGTLEPGQRKVFRSFRLWIRVDAPANVTVSVNGHHRALPGAGFPRTLILSQGGQMKLASARA